MKLTVINGSMRHGSTWHCMDQIRQELTKYDEIETTEFFLPKDMPHFCSSCFSCFYNGEKTCPHAEAVSPIAKAILEADLVILTSSVYALDVTGQLKALLDHLCYMWISHRPNPNMFNKIGLTITTTGGAGLGHTTKTMRNSLSFWGVKKSFSFKGRVAAMKWSDVSEKTRLKIDKDTAALAKKNRSIGTESKKAPEPAVQKLYV